MAESSINVEIKAIAYNDCGAFSLVQRAVDLLQGGYSSGKLIIEGGDYVEWCSVELTAKGGDESA